jgi:hypothetical protein
MSVGIYVDVISFNWVQGFRHIEVEQKWHMKSSSLSQKLRPKTQNHWIAFLFKNNSKNYVFSTISNTLYNNFNKNISIKFDFLTLNNT